MCVWVPKYIAFISQQISFLSSKYSEYWTKQLIYKYLGTNNYCIILKFYNFSRQYFESPTIELNDEPTSALEIMHCKKKYVT